MALNLIRNARAFFTTNVDATNGRFKTDTATTTGDTFEIQVLEGFSFSQNANSEQITVSEAGVAPVRGQRSFNTSLAPVDFSFSTYIRPYRDTEVKAEEEVLWNALMGSISLNTSLGGTIQDIAYSTTTNAVTITGTGFPTSVKAGDKLLLNGVVVGTTAAADILKEKAVNCSGTVTGTPTTTEIILRLDIDAGSEAILLGDTVTVGDAKLYTSAWGKGIDQSLAGFHGSNTNQLQKFAMLVSVDNVTYAIQNCALNEATIDFGLDGIATVQWTGQATELKELTSSNIFSSTAGQFNTIAGAFANGGTFRQKITTANFITNKLSTVQLKTLTAVGSATAGQKYYVALTGGSITISNNISYITPAILGTVNVPAVYFTGTRSVTGTLNAYLNTGAATDSTTYEAGGTGNLLRDMLASAATLVEPKFELEIAIGGSSNALRVELAMPSVSITVPSVNTEQVVSTSINFTGAPSTVTGTATTYDLNQSNELLVRYYAPAA